VGPTVTFVDFGMVGTLANSTKQAARDLFLGFLAGSAHAMVDALQRLEIIGPGANVAALERGVALLLAQYRGISLGQARDLDYPNVVSEIEALFYGQPFRLPATFAFAGKAIGTVAGVATGLAPELNLIEVAAPYARRFLGMDAAGAGQSAQQLLSQVLAGSRSLLTLPAALERVVAKLETGQIEIALSDTPGRRRGRAAAPGRSGGAMGAAMFATSLAGGVVLFTQDLSAPGWFCLGLAGLIGLAQTLRR
jgi:predicted unusual protein kinase regulating ubiquinone biosynthesis (AarF/ABC1/UbiB family)